MASELEVQDDIILLNDKVDNVHVKIIGSTLFVDSMVEEEIQKYIDYIKKKLEPDDIVLEELIIKELPYNMIHLEYEANGIKFNRLRRITGYLTNTLDRWNDSKQHEEKDRLKHI